MRLIVGGSLAAILMVFTSGCELLNSGAATVAGAEPPQPPTASLRTVALTERPSYESLGAYFCADLVGAACGFVFDRIPVKTDLRFGFETVFDLGNPNGFPVPLVELLLALDVFEGEAQAALATVCVTFCDPEAEDCDQRADGCLAEGEEVRDITDFEPTIDDLINIATAAVTGELFDNLSFRYIPARAAKACMPGGLDCETRDGQMCCGDDCQPLGAGCVVGSNDAGDPCQVCPGAIEARVRFELGVDAMLGLVEQLFTDSVDQLARGRSITFDIPYSATGTLFFDVPALGRFGLGYGPLSGAWSLD